MKIRNLDLKSKAEAILFSAGKKIEIDEIVNMIRIRDRQGIIDSLEELRKDYDDRQGALMIVQDGTAWKMVVREKYLSIVQRIVADTELSKTVMETLAIIAWKQPVLQSEIIAIRTNKAYDHITELETMGFLTTEKKGRSRLLKLSQKFYDYFDIKNEKDLQRVFKERLSTEGNMKKHEVDDLQKQAEEIQAEAQVLEISSEQPKIEAIETDTPDDLPEEDNIPEKKDEEEIKEILDNIKRK